MENKNICKNCNSPDINNFCGDCGQKVYHERFTIKSFFVVLLDAIDVKRGFLFTVRMLFVNPGKVTNDYISGKTKSYFNPLKYLLIIGSIYAFLILRLNIFDAGLESFGMPQPSTDEALQLQNQWLNFYKKILNFVPILLIPFISIASKWIAKSKGLYYGEHLVINSFLFVQILVLIVLLTPLVAIFPSIASFFPYITLVIIIVYLCYSLNSTYKESLIRSILRAIFSLVMGYLLFMLFVIIIMIIVGIIIKMN